MSPDRALVYGFGQTGEAVARQLVARGWAVAAVDDHPTDASRAQAAAIGVELIGAPDETDLRALVDRVEVVLPGPGVPIHHRVVLMARAAGVPVWSEFELVSRWGHPPLVAVTGTNGKTTVCTLITEMLAAAGRRVVAAGNNELPLVDALDQQLDVIVVEASSFRLEFTETFRPSVATWLNVTEDHLDWHGSLEAYAAAKAKLWANQTGEDLAVANAEDPMVMAATRRIAATLRTYALDSHDAYAHVDGENLVVGGDVMMCVDELARSWPHDVSNALAAAVSAYAAGADLDSCARVLRAFRGLPHRVELIGDAGGVQYYDDSKATTPASVVTAVSGFDSVVLIAGGKNKGLDLGVLATVAERVRAVVAIGEAGPLVEAAFAGKRPVVAAGSMDDAVAAARDAARPGDAVLLSPGCASQDWYRNYGERGDDFARAVRQLIGAA
jgi:UDP-N-acetylmuramoylalanine--D-glutamate ligase